MKKGILQRVSKNWEEIKMAPPPEVKQEPIADFPEPPDVPATPLESKVSQLPRQPEVKKRDSMISVRKDYSYKYSAKPKVVERFNDIAVSSPIASSSVQSNKKAIVKSKDSSKRSVLPISILERYDYDKAGPSLPKVQKIEDKMSAIKPAQHSSKSHVPMPVQGDSGKSELHPVKVVVESPVIKQEPEPPKDPQNINKINNKINIIFQLNDNTKSLRKNIILHRRPTKKMVQKITIKETNNNTKIQTDDAILSEKVLCSMETQTEAFSLNVSTTCPLVDEPTEHLFFENDVLISLQAATISFFDFNQLSSLLKKGLPDFRLIDRIPRRLHDTLIDGDNKFQRLCYNDFNPLPIYVEMRAKQKELDDPLMCPIAFLYCNVYYIDQKRAKFTSVHLDTVKSIITDIIYTTVPGSSYFIMAWCEKPVDTKGLVTGIVKYKLTPNLDLAKLASIRQFPKLNYRAKQMNCGKDSQLITFGDSQVSIFNYESGDLLMSLDLMKSYGSNLTTFAFKENYLFMVYLASDDTSKRINVIGVNKCEGNTFKVIQSTPVKLKPRDKIISKAITSTNHLTVTFASGYVLMLHLNNFLDLHVHGTPRSDLIFAAGNHLLTSHDNNVGLRNFTEFFLN